MSRAKTNNSTKRIVDAAMTVLHLCLMASQVTGEALHEWIGNSSRPEAERQNTDSTCLYFYMYQRYRPVAVPAKRDPELPVLPRSWIMRKPEDWYFLKTC